MIHQGVVCDIDFSEQRREELKGQEVINVTHNRGLPKGLSQSCHGLLVCPEMREAQW